MVKHKLVPEFEFETSFKPSLNLYAASICSSKSVLSLTISQTSVLSPYARSFIPYLAKSKLNDIIGSMFCSFITILISLLIILHIIKVDKVDKGDEMIPKDINHT